MKHTFNYLLIAALAGSLFTACKHEQPTPELEPVSTLPEWYWTGGQLGTTTSTATTCFRQPTPATENAGMGVQFSQGHNIAEKPFVTSASGRQAGLGPLYVRASCQHCHPAYSHGTRIRIFHFFLKIFKSNENNTNIINRIFFHTIFNYSISYSSTK